MRIYTVAIKIGPLPTWLMRDADILLYIGVHEKGLEQITNGAET